MHSQKVREGVRRRHVELTPLEPRSSSTLVAHALRRLVALGELPPDERLPSERELSESLRVGRDSIRAGMRILAGEGLVETRRGRYGGTFVTHSPVQQQEISTEILASRREIMDSYEFRRFIEPAAASLAAQRADALDIQRIASIAEEVATSVRSWRVIDSRFHSAVAQATGNAFFLEAVEHTRTALFSWYDSIYSRVSWDMLPIQDRDFGHFHRPIAEAIARRDAELAGNLMRAALEWSERDLVDILDGLVVSMVK